MDAVLLEEKICDIIRGHMKNNHLSHAYLIETGDYLKSDDLMMKIVKSILCFKQGKHDELEKCNICNLIDSNQYTDLKFIYPQGNVIKKEQLLEIKKVFKTTPLNQYRIYVIFEAECLNASSANTILKFLEEPEPGVIAFLVAKNRYQVLETIVSRCQILTFSNYLEREIDSKVYDFIQRIVTNSDFYLDFKDILTLYMPDKNASKLLLDDLEFYLHQLLLYKTNSISTLECAELFTNLSKNSIIKYIAILEEEKEKLLYNVNYRLWLDHLLVRFLEVLT